MLSFYRSSLALALWTLSTAAAQTFEYVVVGGGTAGAALAARLAEASRSVALIEAGTRYESSWPLAAIPGADVLPVGSDPETNMPADWGFVTAPQPNANGRRVHFARGKCLGGSPTIESLAQWAQAVDDESYTFERVLPYYKRNAHFTPPNTTSRLENATVQYNENSFAAGNGPLEVSYSDFAMPFSTWMKLGMDAIGLPEAADFNSGHLNGSQYCTSTIKASDQSRSSSASSYLDSATSTTLTVFDRTLAKKILFDAQKNAVGVQVADSWGTLSNITASREIIVSGGAFQSPQLLMVSGVGPADELRRHHIPVVSDLPGVGQNLWDHPFFAPSYRVNVETFTRLANDFGYLAARSLEYIISHTGPLTNPVADFIAWEKIPADLRSDFSSGTQQALAAFPDDWPEAEYMSGAGYVGNFSNLLTNQPKDGYQYASILGVLIAPTSRGNISLQSADTSDPPVINPNWLATKADQELAVAMFRRIRQAFASEQMSPVVIGNEYSPGIATQEDAQILNWIRNNVMTLWHPACTCKMGVASDPLAVVDSQARVFGVKKLRVVDASAFPFLPPGHPQSSVYMLAEKIADQILSG
ncbi:GMC family oxidoreductase [Aspergillus lucknowensis]|uniref:Glucose-methanol-choline oxidoreductase N-terminal domain-containing protein n=1 Tax=Aspergillus lucknowensis TaxID=176173 RepID=A0ABR4LQX9_9EURO